MKPPLANKISYGGNINLAYNSLFHPSNQIDLKTVFIDDQNFRSLFMILFVKKMGTWVLRCMVAFFLCHLWKSLHLPVQM